jgi:hypothetical protein
MELSVEEILRRLLLLGVPLVPLACGNADQRESPDAMMMVDTAGEGGHQGGSGGMGGVAGGTAGVGDLAGMGGGEGGNQGGFGGGPPACPPPLQLDAIVTRSTMNMAAFDKCFSFADCMDLCGTVSNVPPSAYGRECVRTNPPIVDGGVDGGPSDAGTGGSSLTLHIIVNPMPCGRRPAGMERLRLSARGGNVGRWLAHAAALEAASVPAFRRLARELAAHGAPARLVEAARAAVSEEARHYALMARAARAHGAEPRRPRVRSLGVRPLPEVARENAREGCVRETYGAMMAALQARRASEPELRATMASIVRDEARHARLAWEVDAWARSVLPRADARSVEAARRAEGGALVDEVRSSALPAAAARALGLPTAARAGRHARVAQRALWAA